MKDAQAPTPNDFHETARKDVEQWKECVAAHSVPECVRSYKPQQLVKGMYAQFLPVRVPPGHQQLGTQ
jgi:N-acetylgalactosamine 4-sulfate 6-O-sulfotransferase